MDCTTRGNSSDPDAPLANVTTTVSHNIYVYSSNKLWLAYGIATAPTAVAVTQGLFVMYSSGASYTSNFSTVMRSTWSAELSVDPLQAGDDCRDHPLPRNLARVTVKLPATARRRFEPRARWSEDKSGAKVVYANVANTPGDTGFE